MTQSAAEPTTHTPYTAHVGYTGTNEDYVRLTRAESWLACQLGEDAYVDMASWREHDVVDLSEGRDFLAETKQYEVVVLHHLFRGLKYVNYGADLSAEKLARLAVEQGCAATAFSTSERQSAGAWHERLEASGAKWLFVFGMYQEVSGLWLGDVPGYDMVGAPSLFEMLTVYKKKEVT